jgi:DNA-binding transcriptional ArsR family regulator
MTVPAGYKGLRFPCECVSSRPGGYSEPWAPIAKNKLLPDGTKEEILNVLARGPNTITQIAETLGLSAPSVHTHVSDMIRSELLREAVQWQKIHPAERYYEPNFPVISEKQAEELCTLCNDLGAEVAAIMKKSRLKLEKAFQTTALHEKGWRFEDVAQFIFARVQRSARKRLEGEGLLRAAESHRNGIDWVFWAEEPATNGKK